MKESAFMIQSKIAIHNSIVDIIKIASEKSYLF